jgi:hypothetical protein
MIAVHHRKIKAPLPNLAQVRERVFALVFDGVRGERVILGAAAVSERKPIVAN